MLTFISKCFRPMQPVNGVRWARVFGETNELVSIVVLTDRRWTAARELVAQLLDARQVLIARTIQSVRLAQFRCKRRNNVQGVQSPLERILPMFEQR